MNIFVLSPLLRFRSHDDRQKIPYECGMEPIGSPYVPMDIRFYLFALLFVIFDVESLFLFPWAIIYRKLAFFGLIEMLVFLGILIVGYIWIIKKGALDWA